MARPMQLADLLFRRYVDVLPGFVDLASKPTPVFHAHAGTRAARLRLLKLVLVQIAALPHFAETSMTLRDGSRCRLGRHRGRRYLTVGLILLQAFAHSFFRHGGALLACFAHVRASHGTPRHEE